MRRLGSIPNEARTSAALVRGAAPSLSSAFVPATASDVISPGTAKTSRPSSSARSAVISAPLRSRASTTTVAAQSPATMRLRAGNRQGAGSTPGAYSETMRPASRDATRELGVRGRIVAIDAAAEDGDRRPVRLERPAMRLGVDAAGEPAHDDEPGSRELPAQAAGDRGAVPGACARAHDRHRRLGEKLGLRQAAEEEPRRRIVDRSEERREVRRRPRRRSDAAAASRSRYARSSKRRSNARQRSPRGGRTRCVPVSEAKTASASSDTRELVRRAIGERLRHVLGSHRVGLRERGDRPRDPADARVAPSG